jgi:FkbM family methyltransferase
METRNIYLYWINKEYKLISILRNLIYLHSTNGKGYKIHLVTDKNISDYIPDIPAYFSNLCPAHQADFVRVNVICDYGGIWLDSDTLVVDSLDSLFDFIETKNGFFIKENNNILWNGIFGSRPNTTLMIEWKKQMRNLLDIKLGKINWCDIGNSMLKDIYNKNADLYDNYNIFNGLDNLYPVNWNNCVTEFIDKPYDNYKTIVREYQPLVVLVNSVYKKLETMTEHEILEGGMPINYFINKSFENVSIYKNRLYTNQYIWNYGKSDYISGSIVAYKCWEPNISNVFDNIIKNNTNPQSAIIDIGCNIGYFSLLCAKHTSINMIYSIDGNVDNINMLNMSCIHNGINNIHPINAIISEKLGDVYKPANKEFAKSVNNIGGLSYAQTTDNITNDTAISTTIDEIIKIHNIEEVIIMKMDIEGGELNGLKGAINTLKTNIIKNVIIEISPKFNNDSVEILQILKDNNYNLFNIPHMECGKYNDDTHFINKICTHPIIDIHTFVRGIGPQTNILAIKNKHIPKYVIYTDWIKSYLTREHFMFVKNLELFGWNIIELSKLNIGQIKKEKCVVLCVTYDDFDMSLIKCDNVQLIYKIDDLYPYKDIRNKCIDNSDMIISPYQYLFNTEEIKKMYKNINSPKTFHIPYSSVDDFFKDIEFNNNPVNKIFVSGAVSYVYPLRRFIKYDTKFKEYIDCLDHPSYNSYKHECINELYYKKLNEYVCCFVDCSLYKYVLLKVFETCSVGSLLLVEDTISTELNNLGFYDNVNCIFCNKTNLEDKIKWILNVENRHLVDNVRKLGMELVRQKHTTKNRSEQFNIIIENKVANK